MNTNFLSLEIQWCLYQLTSTSYARTLVRVKQAHCTILCLVPFRAIRTNTTHLMVYYVGFIFLFFYVTKLSDRRRTHDACVRRVYYVHAKSLKAVGDRKRYDDRRRVHCDILLCWKYVFRRVTSAYVYRLRRWLRNAFVWETIIRDGKRTKKWTRTNRKRACLSLQHIDTRAVFK